MSQGERRNPYVILGVPFGASGEQARAGFARKSRHLRQHPNAMYTIEDLTWALHQVEQLITHPELAFDTYRIPASPKALRGTENGVFRPAPHRLPRLTKPDIGEWESIRRHALADALRRAMSRTIPSTTSYMPYE